MNRRLAATSSARRLAPAAGYLLLVLLFFAPILSGRFAFPDGDFTQHFLPFSLFQRDALFAARLPLWNPHTYAGHPFLADVQAAVFYPVSNGFLFLTGWAQSLNARLYWLQVEAIFHIFLACSFTFLLVHRLTGNRLAGFIAGLVFGFSGFLTGYPPLQLAILRTAVWLPLILLLLLPGPHGWGRWPRWMAAAAVHAVAFYAGHPQTFLLLSYAVAGWLLVLGIARARGAGGGRILLPLLARVVVYAGLLLLLTLAQLWPALAFTRLSVRAALSYAELSRGFPLADTWQMLLPGVLTHFSPLYVGLIPLGLALLAGAALLFPGCALPGADAPARAAGIFFCLCAAAALLISYGANGPLYPLLYRFAPGWDLFRGQERAAFLVAFSLSALSGYGVALLPGLSAPWRKKFAWGYAGASAVGVVGFLLLRQMPGTSAVPLPEFLRVAAVALLLAAAFVGLLVRRWQLLLLVPLIAGDLFLANAGTNLADGAAVRAALRPSAATATTATATAAASPALPNPQQLPPRVYNEFRLPGNSGMLHGWEDVWGSSPLRLAAYDRLFVDFPLDRMWQLTGVETVLTWRRELFVPSQLLAEFPQATDTTYLHRLPSPAPRIWWTQQARRVEDAAALALLADHSFDLRSGLLLPPAEAARLQEFWQGDVWQGDRLLTGQGGQAQWTVQRPRPGRIRIRLESSQPGLLFVSENWLPGWQATWQGADDPAPRFLPRLRAHYAFLGLPVPAGAGLLELSYRPRGVVWGGAISGAAWAGLLLALLWWLRRGGRRKIAGAARQ